MQMPTLFPASRLSFPPLYRWNKSLRRVIWTAAVIGVAAVYLLMAAGVVSGLALAVGTVVR